MSRESDDRRTVLVVEDMAWIRDGMVMSLGRHGYRVVTAEDAAEAIALAESVRPDLILTEEAVPTFKDLMSLRRRHPTLSHVPVVILNPDAEEGTRFDDAILLSSYDQMEQLLDRPAIRFHADADESS